MLFRWISYPAELFYSPPHQSISIDYYLQNFIVLLKEAVSSDFMRLMVSF